MTTAASPSQTVPPQTASAPALRAADRRMASSLESLLSDTPAAPTPPNGASSSVGATRWGSPPCRPSLSPWPRYLAARAGSGALIATLRLAASAFSKAHEWARLDSPCRYLGMCAY